MSKFSMNDHISKKLEKSLTEQDLADLLPAALRSPRATVIDVRVEPEENVYPMVPTGAALDEMLLV